MPNILEDLYYGNLSPCQRTVRPGSQVQKAMLKRDEIENSQRIIVSCFFRIIP